MAILTSLTIYPIKSCGGIEVTEARVNRTGLSVGEIHDRQWMIVDLEGEFLTQREIPKMALIKPELAGDGLNLHFPGTRPFALPPPSSLLQHQCMKVRIWDDAVEAMDQGDEAAAWLSNALGASCRLVAFGPNARRLASAKWTDGMDAPTRFSDGFPMLLIGQESLNDLNRKLSGCGREALPMNRFRPNLVINGIEAFEEDYLDSLQIADVALKPVKPCPRCPIPAIDQESGLAGPDPLDILQTYRSNPRVNDAVTFGMNVILVSGEGSVLRTGQEIITELSF